MNVTSAVRGPISAATCSGSGPRYGSASTHRIRIPWRAALDYLWFGTPGARQAVTKISSWANTVGIANLVDGVTRKTFTAMIEGVRDAAIAAGLSDPAAFDAGVRDLYRAMEPDGVFCYTFFKAVGSKS